jgi:hypothetical protein
MKRKLFALVLLVALVACFRTVEATTINAFSCSQSDVGNAVAAASNGDIVTIPAGDCTWTSQLNVNVGITLAGEGWRQYVESDVVLGRCS